MKKDEIIQKQDEYISFLLKFFGANQESIKTKSMIRFESELSTLKSELPEPEQQASIKERIIRLIKRGYNIDAVRTYKIEMNCDLKEAKYQVGLIRQEINPELKQPDPLLKESGGKLNKIVEEDKNPDFDYEYDQMTLAQKTLTDFSDGHYTQFPGYENILMAMEEYARKFQEQSITVTDELIEKLKRLVKIYELLYKDNTIDYVSRYVLYAEIAELTQRALSLKAQPGDKDIETWIECQFLPTEFDDRYNLSEVAKSFVKDGMRIALKAMRDGLIPAKDKE